MKPLSTGSTYLPPKLGKAGFPGQLYISTPSWGSAATTLAVVYWGAAGTTAAGCQLVGNPGMKPLSTGSTYLPPKLGKAGFPGQLYISTPSWGSAATTLAQWSIGVLPALQLQRSELDISGPSIRRDLKSWSCTTRMRRGRLKMTFLIMSGSPNVTTHVSGFDPLTSGLPVQKANH